MNNLNKRTRRVIVGQRPECAGMTPTREFFLLRGGEAKAPPMLLPIVGRCLRR